jgi:hypothetical protein
LNAEDGPAGEVGLDAEDCLGGEDGLDAEDGPAGEVGLDAEDCLDGEDGLDAEDALEGEGASDVKPIAAEIATMATSTPPLRRVRIRIRRVGSCAGSLEVMPPVKAAWCCQRVCGFRYAGDMRRS